MRNETRKKLFCIFLYAIHCCWLCHVIFSTIRHFFSFYLSLSVALQEHIDRIHLTPLCFYTKTVLLLHCHKFAWFCWIFLSSLCAILSFHIFHYQQYQYKQSDNTCCIHCRCKLWSKYNVREDSEKIKKNFHYNIL